jgi:hypothetical protein
MTPNDNLPKPVKLPDENDLENPTLEWADEDIEIEGRKPDLSEIEEDESTL